MPSDVREDLVPQDVAEALVRVRCEQSKRLIVERVFPLARECLGELKREVRHHFVRSVVRQLEKGSDDLIETDKVQASDEVLDSGVQQRAPRPPHFYFAPCTGAAIRIARQVQRLALAFSWKARTSSAVLPAPPVVRRRPELEFAAPLSPPALRDKWLQQAGSTGDTALLETEASPVAEGVPPSSSTLSAAL